MTPGARQRGRRGALAVAVCGGGLWLLLVAACAEAWGQETPAAPAAPPAAPAAPPTEAGGETPAEGVGQEEDSSRPGRYRIGPFYLTPSFKIGSIGLDTNVLYTPSERRADVMATGGPGLELVLPVRRTLRLRGLGQATYIYFVRTASQRRLVGNGSGALEWQGNRTGLTLEAAMARQRERPSLELDRRLLYSDTSQRVSLHRKLTGALTLRLTGQHLRREVDEGEEHLGVDLRQSLSREETTWAGDLDYALSIKTSVAATFDRVTTRFLHGSSRMADVDRLLMGLRTDSTALISGRAMAGILWSRPRTSAARPRRLGIYVIDAMLNLSLKTHIGGFYQSGLTFSSLAASAAAPTLRTESYGVRLDKDLKGNLNLELFWRRTRLRDDGALEIVLPDGGLAQGERHDTADETGADLGYRFRPRLRIGVAASHVRRRSNIAYFGIQGLLVGLTVRYNP